MLDRTLRNFLQAMLEERFEDAAKLADDMSTQLHYGVTCESFLTDAAITDARLLKNSTLWESLFSELKMYAVNTHSSSYDG